MRRNLNQHSEYEASRSGVMHSVIIKKWSVHLPQVCSITATGSAPKETPAKPTAPAVKRNAGIRQATNTKGFTTHRTSHGRPRPKGAFRETPIAPAIKSISADPFRCKDLR